MIIAEKFTHEEVVGLKFGSFPFGRPKMFSHLYFIDGLLIDTGHRNMSKQIIANTKSLSVEQIFITHHHEDHTGNIQAIRREFNCKVYASELCCQIMKAPPPLSFAQKLLWGDREAQSDLLPKKDYIATKQFRFEIIPIPGHSSDMVALYEPNRRWLFSADLYVNSYISYFLENERMVDQIASIKSILNLDFKALFCSHNPQFHHGKQKLQDKLHFLESFFHDVSTLYRQGYAPAEIFKQSNFKENRWIKFLSGGNLSKMNMVKSVIRDLQMEKEENKNTI